MVYTTGQQCKQHWNYKFRFRLKMPQHFHDEGKKGCYKPNIILLWVQCCNIQKRTSTKFLTQVAFKDIECVHRVFNSHIFHIYSDRHKLWPMKAKKKCIIFLLGNEHSFLNSKHSIRVHIDCHFFFFFFFRVGYRQTEMQSYKPH